MPALDPLLTVRHLITLQLSSQEVFSEPDLSNYSENHVIAKIIRFAAEKGIHDLGLERTKIGP